MQRLPALVSWIVGYLLSPVGAGGTFWTNISPKLVIGLTKIATGLCVIFLLIPPPDIWATNWALFGL